MVLIFGIIACGNTLSKIRGALILDRLDLILLKLEEYIATEKYDESIKLIESYRESTESYP